MRVSYFRVSGYTTLVETLFSKKTLEILDFLVVKIIPY
jgi:hypothetical protein